MSRRITAIAITAAILMIAGCATQAQVAVQSQAPGFWWGVLHGVIFPFAWVGSLFSDEIAVYAVPNSGGWYDFGFFIGICILGGGSIGGSRR